MFIDRDETNQIVACYNVAQRKGQEKVDDAAADLLAFKEKITNPQPGQVSSGQLIIALDELGWLDAVDAAVGEAAPLPQRLWARASFFPRDDAMVIAIAAEIGKSSEELDQLFRLAASK